MKRLLLLLFIVIPLLEIVTIIEVGKRIGAWPTFAIIVALSLLGAYIIKKQGMRAWKQIREEMAMGMIPGESLLDGACVLVGGTLLLLPGFITDVLGLLLLVPFLRGFFKGLLKIWLFKIMSRGQIRMYRR